MSVPLLVLDCGSWSIDFALFDVAAEPLPRQPLRAGRVEVRTSNGVLRIADREHVHD